MARDDPRALGPRGRRSPPEMRDDLDACLNGHVRLPNDAPGKLTSTRPLDGARLGSRRPGRGGERGVDGRYARRRRSAAGLYGSATPAPPL